MIISMSVQICPYLYRLCQSLFHLTRRAWWTSPHHLKSTHIWVVFFFFAVVFVFLPPPPSTHLPLTSVSVHIYHYVDKDNYLFIHCIDILQPPLRSRYFWVISQWNKLTSAIWMSTVSGIQCEKEVKVRHPVFRHFNGTNWAWIAAMEVGTTP